MKLHRSTSVLAAATLIAAGSLSLSAQKSPAGLSAKAGAPRAVTVSPTTAAKQKANNLTTIQGNALSSTNGPLNDVAVRLRDARFGTIVDTQMTDKSGLFAFKSIDPGSYIVEVMANDQTSVLAASQMLNIDAGQAMSAVVKLPFRIPPFAGIVGSGTTTPAATAVAAQAVATGVVAVVPTAPISPTQ